MSINANFLIPKYQGIISGGKGANPLDKMMDSEKPQPKETTQPQQPKVEDKSIFG